MNFYMKDRGGGGGRKEMKEMTIKETRAQSNEEKITK